MVAASFGPTEVCGDVPPDVLGADHANALPVEESCAIQPEPGAFCCTVKPVPVTSIALTCEFSHVGNDRVSPLPLVAGVPPYGAAALSASTVFWTVSASVAPIRIPPYCVLSSAVTNV